jgi:peptidoglycan/xylan/chitin deacetylase (PgdA/CDA1 family)
MGVSPWSIAIPAAGMVAGLVTWGAVSPTSQLLGPSLCRTPHPMQIALTFDDGPNPAITPQLLALLERYQVRATFFLVGRFARACPELAREIAAHGHVIGNHTETHPNLALSSMSRVQDELVHCQESIASALARAGTPEQLPRWFRPPFGYRLPSVWRAAHRVGLRGVVTWSLTAYDWKPQPPVQLMGRLAWVTIRARDGGSLTSRATGEVVLLHDGDHRRLGADRSHTLVALEHWLPRWRTAGFEFVTIDQVADASSFGG